MIIPVQTHCSASAGENCSLIPGGRVYTKQLVGFPETNLTGTFAARLHLLFYLPGSEVPPLLSSLLSKTKSASSVLSPSFLVSHEGRTL